MPLTQTTSPQSTLLVVEDNPALLVALRDILEDAGYAVHTAQNGREALSILETGLPALILSDIAMPVMDGFELYENVRLKPGGMSIPFIFLTARQTREEVFAGKKLGADDYLTKPVSSQELVAAVEARLRRSDEIRVAQLEEAYKASLRVLANAIEARDHYTHDHVTRVNDYAQALARELGWSEDSRNILEFGAILHDIGKIAVRETILRKPAALDEGEWEEMREHPLVGARMIQDIPYLKPALPLVLHHHERWDGTGYPSGLTALEIPIEARLLAVADSLDAITTDRPYRKATDPRVAYEIISQEVGMQFDPLMVATFRICWSNGELKKIASSARNGTQ